jgi:AraC family transcriptional regulator
MKVKNEPEIKELNERTVAFVSFVGNYMGNSEVFAGLFGKLCGWAGPKGLMEAGSVFLSSYQQDPKITPPEEMKVEVCMEVPKDTEVEGEIQKQILPGGKYVVIRVELTGPEEYGPAWMKVVEWMKENNQEIDMSRPSYEIYLNEPDKHPEKHHILDICMGAK